MIRYTLNCAEGHAFESWFQSGDAFDTLVASSRVTCPGCGSSSVEKSLMAPTVRPARSKSVARPEDRPLATPSSPVEEALAALRKQVEDNSDYVGMNFVSEARRIHAGEAPDRSIYGQAKPEEARKLIEDGVPVAPLPFMPRRGSN
jgi:hypothetical protein